jgi:phage baseplate assembly protein W
MATYTGLFKLYPTTGTSEDGFITTDRDVIRNSLLMIINTHKGSRIYDPDFGTNIHHLIHEQNIQRTRNVAKMEIEKAVSKYEPRAEILEIDAYPGEGSLSNEVVIVINVLYIEYGETEELEIRLAGEHNWISEEGTHIDPVNDWFANNDKG